MFYTTQPPWLDTVIRNLFRGSNIRFWKNERGFLIHFATSLFGPHKLMHFMINLSPEMKFNTNVSQLYLWCIPKCADCHCFFLFFVHCLKMNKIGYDQIQWLIKVVWFCVKLKELYFACKKYSNGKGGQSWIFLKSNQILD